MSFSSKEYFVRETYKSIHRNGFMSVASVVTVTMCMAVLSMFLMMAINTNKISTYLESQVQISVYMQEGVSSKELEDTEKKLKAMPGVLNVLPVTKEEALERFQERMGDQQQLLDALDKDNPFPYSFEVKTSKPEDIKTLIPEISKLPKVEATKFGREVVDHLFTFAHFIRFCGAVIVVFLGLVTVFIISNTIRLTVFARRKEVNIMKYVGATDWFIRWPFLLEGMTLGFIGSVIASVLTDFIYKLLVVKIHSTMAFLPIVPAVPILYYVNLFTIVVGVAVGALGSYISLRKFLKV